MMDISLELSFSTWIEEASSLFEIISVLHDIVGVPHDIVGDRGGLTVRIIILIPISEVPTVISRATQVRIPKIVPLL